MVGVLVDEQAALDGSPRIFEVRALGIQASMYESLEGYPIPRAGGCECDLLSVERTLGVQAHSLLDAHVFVNAMTSGQLAQELEWKPELSVISCLCAEPR